MIGTPRRVGASLLGLLGAGVLLVAFGAFDAQSARAVGPTPSTTTLSSNANPSVYGQSLTLTGVVTATPPATGTPTGQVKFFDGATLLSTKNLSNGTASYTTTYPVATHTFTATYQGDVVFAVSTSAVLNQVVQPTPTSTVVVSGANPSNLGNTPTFTATTTATAPGNGAPSSGTLKFYDGTVVLASKTPAGGVATYKPASLTLGTHSITAVFSGSASYLTSTSAPLTQTVGPAVTSTGVTSSANPSSLGGSVTVTATVSSVAGTPTGTVSFTDGATALGTATLASGQATITTSSLTIGTHPITAAYSGAASYQASTSAPFNQVVDRAASITTVTSAPNPSVNGSAFTLTATVASTAGAPTGTVNFAEGATALGSTTLAANSAELSVAGLGGGSHVITATYAGDSSFAPSTSTPITQVVDPAPSAVSLTSSANPSALGTAVSFTATVTSSAGTPTGTVSFIDGASVVGSATLASGQTTVELSNLAVGTHSLTALYIATADFASSTSTSLSQVVDPAPSTTTVASSANPSGVGDPVVFTASVSSPSGSPTGTVAFTDGVQAIGTANLTSGQASLTVSDLASGGHTITATYSGDSNVAASVSAPFAQSVDTAPSTVTTLASSANPSTFGEAITVTATVTSTVTSVAGPPTGTIAFTDGPVAIGTANLTSGQASLTVSDLASGSHTITATYSGDGSFLASTSSPLTQVVNPAATVTTVTSSGDPSTLGGAVTFTATVTSTAGAPTGTVTFTDGPTTLGTNTITNGAAALTTSTLGGGLHSITASYSGDSTFATSTSSPLSQSVNPAATAITLTSSVNPSAFGAAVDFTATVTSAAGTPTGLVSLLDDTTLVGDANLSNGTATITISNLSVGTHSLTASYGATADYAASTSTALGQTVITPTTTSVDSSANPSTYGEAVTLTATVTGNSPTGSVTFFAGATPLGVGSIANGQSSLSVQTLNAGSQSITAAYSGDANNTPSSSAAITQVVNPAASTTSLVSGPNPGFLGQTITLTATVISPSGSPTGTVTYRDGTTVLGTSTLTNGQGSIDVTTLGAGTHSLSAVFGANPNVTGSTSTSVTETILVTTIYVDRENASCRTSGTGAGLPATPYCSINSAAAKVVAGQTVQVATGVYPGRVTVAVTGTQASPITFAPAPGATVTITSAINGFLMSGKSWVTIRGFEIDHTAGVGISASNSSNITIDGNHVMYSGLPTNGSTAAGIRLSGSTNSSVVNNITDHNSDAGILITTNADNNVIAHNESFANARGYVRAAAGIDLRNSTGLLVFDNVVHENEDSGINVWTGLNYGSSTVYDNVAYGNGDHGIDVHNSVDAHIVANTVYNNSDSGIEMTTSVRVTLNNNVSVDNGINSPRTAGNVRADVSSVSGGCVIQDDLVFLRTPGIMFDWNNVKYSSLAALQTATGLESRGIEADPRFTSTASANFRLLAGSPAIDTANTSAVGQPSVDFDEVSRFDDPATLNTGIGPITFADRGAFEYHP